MLGLELDMQRQSEGLHNSVLRVDQLVDGYRETEPRQLGSRVRPSPDDIRKGLAVGVADGQAFRVFRKKHGCLVDR